MGTWKHTDPKAPCIAEEFYIHFAILGVPKAAPAAASDTSCKFWILFKGSHIAAIYIGGDQGRSEDRKKSLSVQEGA